MKKWYEDWKMEYGTEEKPIERIIFPHASNDNKGNKGYAVTLKITKKGKKVFVDRIQYALLRLVINLLKELNGNTRI